MNDLDLFGAEHNTRGAYGSHEFCYVNGKPAGTAGAPSVLIAYGQSDADVLAREPWPGHYVALGRAAA